MMTKYINIIIHLSSGLNETRVCIELGYAFKSLLECHLKICYHFGSKDDLGGLLFKL